MNSLDFQETKVEKKKVFSQAVKGGQKEPPGKDHNIKSAEL